MASNDFALSSSQQQFQMQHAGTLLAPGKKNVP